jgi:hypothetical protein
MDNVRRDPVGWLDRLHRVAAVAFGLGLWVFGGLGLLNRLDFFSTQGQPVLGLSSNGALSAVSLVVGAVLILAGIRGGRLASTTLVVVGAAFLLSGVLNSLVLETSLNLLAFRIPNVVFSLVAGALLLILGAWGRFTGNLPDENPYSHGQPTGGADDDRAPDLPARFDASGDATAARELAEAERADAQHAATPEQAERLARVRDARTPEDRVRGWREGS